MVPVLLSRTLDPLLGVFTGVAAYYLYETNPRTGMPENERLTELVRWKLAKRKREAEKEAEKDATLENIDWKAIVAEGERK